MAFDWLLALLQRLFTNVLLKGKFFIYFNTKDFYAVFRINCYVINIQWRRIFHFGFFLTTVAWNFSGLTIISFNLNHSIAAWISVSSVERRFSIVLSAAVIVLSSAKFSRSVFVIQRYRSFINILKRSGPSIEPWGTPDKSTWNTLWVLLILTFCFPLFKYE